MDLFKNIMKAGGKGQPASVGPAEFPADLRQLDTIQEIEGRAERAVSTDADLLLRAGSRTGRTQVYAVRVREGAKGEILGLQAELQLERQRLKGNARKVTEGEIFELMLETFKVVRRNGDAVGYAVPIPNVVWQGVHEIARRLQCSPTEAFEQVVVQKLDELGLLARKPA